jgi:hypothetical protein
VDAPVKVVGIVVGNAITDMTVYSERETDASGKQTVIYEKVEALHLGLAVQTGAIVNLNSAMLGTTIGEHLQRYDLITA